MDAFVEARRLYDEEVQAGGETDHMDIDVSVLKQLGLFPDKYGLEPIPLSHTEAQTRLVKPVDG